MKLRLEDNSLRLRLSSEEVIDFHRTGRLETVVHLGPSVSDRLVYALQRDETLAGSAPSVSYTSGRVVVRLPNAVADAWISSDEVSLSGVVAVADNQEVHILVEKDLGCKH
ncbi:DUF7009 family protein [uncultured Hymenobacter sp.]|uniref:DUF7009 family protein n=1 Tax=uncultured Hymenobacter sp. TaxID=170016 RepID=UPI0035CC67DD